MENYTKVDFAALEVTNLCNLECLHCYASSSPKEKLSRYMNSTRWLRVIDELSELGCKRLQFIGGEPTAHPDLGTLIEYAYSKRFNYLQVFTNGISITEKLWDVFVKCDVSLAFSVYSHDSNIHDGLTTVLGSHKKTENSIRKAVQNALDVAVGIIVENTDDKMHEHKTIQYAESLGVDKNEIGVDRVRSFGRGKKLTAAKDRYSELCGRCWSNRIAVNDKGDVSPCVMSRFVNLGHVSDGLKNLLISDQYKQFQEKRPCYADNEGDFLETSCKPGTNCRCPIPKIVFPDENRTQMHI